MPARPPLPPRVMGAVGVAPLFLPRPNDLPACAHLARPPTHALPVALPAPNDPPRKTIRRPP
ncbi:hypothetical protein tb265_16300 [Gemmatimonadetes bacterium T265]|nr:hypothetical protein tb265_16300 [Gemmatimonadetes bacterium T265]